MTDEERIPIKIFVRDNGRALFVCPSCGFTHEIDVSKYKGRGAQTLSARCRCHKVLAITFDFRGHVRKDVTLSGSFRVLDKGMGHMKGVMMVRNLSLTGMAFEVTSGMEPMVGQKVAVEFHLDDRKMSHIEKDAVIRSTGNGLIGCQFVDYGELDPAIGFYLQSY